MSADLALDRSRNRILLTIAILVSVDVAVALLAYENNRTGAITRTEITDIEVMATTGSAAGFGAIVLYRQGFQGLHGKTYAALTIGLALWTVGEAWWVYDEVILQTELPENSIADLFWLAGYAFFGYHLFKTYRYFERTIDKRLMAAVGVMTGVGILCVVYATNTFSAESDRDLSTMIFRIAYPIGDFVIIFPALLLVVTLRKARLHFSPWFFISAGLLLTAAADISFALVSTYDEIETEWISNLLYNAANVTIAGGLYWYYKHIVRFGMKISQSKASDASPTQGGTSASEVR
jgi:hypothetical protein